MRRTHVHDSTTTALGASPKDSGKTKPYRRERKVLWMVAFASVVALFLLIRYHSGGRPRKPSAPASRMKSMLRSTQRTPSVTKVPVGIDIGNNKDDVNTDAGSNTCYDVLQEIRNVPPSTSPYDALQSVQLLGGTIVVPGHPLTDLSVSGEAYRYFQMCIPDEMSHHHFHNIRIRVEALPASPQKAHGYRLTDPDLFVSASKPHPTIVDSTWLSKRIGGEEVTIPSNHADFPPGTRALYFGVHAHNEGTARFSIAVDILDRKNKYENLRLRDDDVSMRRDVEHETWRPAVE